MLSAWLQQAASPARYWEPMEPHGNAARVRCQLCPRACIIEEEGFGYCGVRGVLDGGLKTFIYGRPSSIAVDPIEKKPLYHFHPGSLVLSLGTVGCNFRCKHCQNWSISMVDAADAGGILSQRPIQPEELVEMCRREGAEGISFTYNEPTIWIEYVLDTFRRFKKETSFYTSLVTNGFISPEPLADLLAVTDAYRVDLKTIDPGNLKKFADYNQPEKVLESIAAAAQRGVHLEIVTTVVTGWNDRAEELAEMAKRLKEIAPLDTPWHFTRYFPQQGYSAPPTPMAKLELAVRLAREQGFRFVYLGNVREENSDTICPECGRKLIERRGYSARALVSKPVCPDCGARLPSIVL
jgi:pyruvate formate lyase activating enzyme